MKKLLIGFFCGTTVAIFWSRNIIREFLKKLERGQKGWECNYVLYHTMNLWLMLTQKGKTIVEYFEEHGYDSIAIYGMGEMGERLYDALYGTDIHVKYGIDKNARNIFTTLNLYTPDQELEEVDVIVVTSIYYFKEIETVLSKKVSCPIVSIDKVIDEVL